MKEEETTRFGKTGSFTMEARRQNGDQFYHEQRREDLHNNAGLTSASVSRDKTCLSLVNLSRSDTWA